jgi:hypothetical protein
MDNLNALKIQRRNSVDVRSSPEKAGTQLGGRRGRETRPPYFAESLLEGEVEAITRKLINRVLEDDTTALRLCLERRVTRIAARELYGRCRQRLAPTTPAFFPDRFSGFVVPQSCVACARCARFKQAGVPLSPGRPKSARPRR